MNEHLEDNCAEFRDALLLLSSGELESEESGRLEAHLRQCAECARMAREMSEAVAAYDELTRETVSTERWQELATRAVSASPQRAWRMDTPWSRIAVAVLLFATGLFLGARSGTNQVDLAGLEGRVQQLETSLLISRLRPASSADRLDVLALVRDQASPPREVWMAILHALDSDPSPNVRLGAIDALRRMESLEPATVYLEELLLRQDSEIITGELVELIVERDLRSLRGSLVRLSDEPGSERVREIARWGLARMGEDA